MPKISVIVPVYNVEKYLKECLDSIINQTLSDIEIICVNDGSTDNSLKILEEYALKDKRIKIINKENGGLSSARNAGLDIAKGEYILFVDSDDYIDSDLAEELINCIEKNSVDVAVYGIQNEAVDEESKVIAKKDQMNYEKYFKKENGIYPVPLELNSDVVTCAVNKLYKKEIIDKYKLRFLEGVIQEDSDWLWTYFLHCKNYYYLNKNKYHYIRRSSSIMGQRTQSIHILDILKIHINIYKNVKKYKNIKDYKKYLAKSFKRDAKNLFKEIDKKYKEEFFKLYREYLKNNFSIYLLLKYAGLRLKGRNK